MLGCSVMGCKSNTLRKIEGISFHTFPNDPEIRKLWRTATNRLNYWDPPRGSRIYSRHFNKEDVLLKCWKENISFSVPVNSKILRAKHQANIVNCRTRATQTHHSHHRREAPCQTTEPRARAVQTTVEAAVNTDGCGRVGYPLWRVGDKVKQFEVCPCKVGIDGEIDKRHTKLSRK